MLNHDQRFSLLGSGAHDDLHQAFDDDDEAAHLVAALRGFKTNTVRARRTMQHRVFLFSVLWAVAAVCIWKFLPTTVSFYGPVIFATNFFLIPYTVCPLMVIDREEFKSGHLVRLLGVFYFAMSLFWLYRPGSRLSCTVLPHLCTNGADNINDPFLEVLHAGCVYAEGATNIALGVLAWIRLNRVSLQVRLFWMLQVFNLFCLLAWKLVFAIYTAVNVGPADWWATARAVIGAVVYLVLLIDIVVRPYRWRGSVMKFFRSRQELRDGIFMATMLEQSAAAAVGDEYWVHRLSKSTRTRVPDERYSEFQHQRYWDKGRVVYTSPEPEKGQLLEAHGGSAELRVAFHNALSRAEEEWVGAASVTSNSPSQLLHHAVVNLRCVEWADISARLLQPETPPAELYARSRPCKPGEIDFFLSHSWYDDAYAKYADLRRLAERFFNAHGRFPSFWIDRACVGTGAACANLHMLPVYIKMANEVVVYCGPTYFSRLWPVWELYTLLVLTSDPENVPLRVISTAGAQSFHNRLAIFDVSKDLHCYNPNEEQQLFAVISTSLEDFNAQVRSFGHLLDRRMRVERQQMAADFHGCSTLAELACAMDDGAVAQSLVLQKLCSGEGTLIVRAASDAEIQRCVAMIGTAILDSSKANLGALGIHHLLLQLQLPRSHERQLCDKGGWASIIDIKTHVLAVDEMAEVAGLPVGHSRKIFRALERRGRAFSVSSFLGRMSSLNSGWDSAQTASSESTPSVADSIPSNIAPGSLVAYSDLVIGPRLGKGANGVVYSAHLGSAPATSAPNVAVKTTHLDMTAEQLELINREISILSSLRHPHVVTFIGISSSPDRELLIVTELCTGDLMGLLTSSPEYRGCNDGQLFLSLAAQIANGMAFLHQKGVIHRDLKPHNVLVKPTGVCGDAAPIVCKLCDFGIAAITQSIDSISEQRQRTIQMGSPAYMAPEVGEGRGGKAQYGGSVDVYSFGIMLWVLWTGACFPVNCQSRV
jgi:hypothetical protein